MNQSPRPKEAGGTLKLPTGLRNTLLIIALSITQLLYSNCPPISRDMAKEKEQIAQGRYDDYFIRRHLFDHPAIWDTESGLIQTEKDPEKLLALLRTIDKALVEDPDAANKLCDRAEELFGLRISTIGEIDPISRDEIRNKIDNQLLQVASQADARKVVGEKLFYFTSLHNSAGKDIYNTRYQELLHMLELLQHSPLAVDQPLDQHIQEIVQILKNGFPFSSQSEESLNIIARSQPEAIFDKEIMKVVMADPQKPYIMGEIRKEYFLSVLQSAMGKPVAALDYFVINGFDQESRRVVVEAALKGIEAMINNNTLDNTDVLYLQTVLENIKNKKACNCMTPDEIKMLDSLPLLVPHFSKNGDYSND